MTTNCYKTDYNQTNESKLYNVASRLTIDIQNNVFVMFKFGCDREYNVPLTKDQLLDILRDIGNHLDDLYYYNKYSLDGLQLEYDINPHSLDYINHVRLSFKYEDQIICFTCSKEMMLGIIFENIQLNQMTL